MDLFDEQTVSKSTVETETVTLDETNTVKEKIIVQEGEQE